MGFSFKPNELTEIPLSMAEAIGNAVSYKGLFVVWPNQDLSELGHVKALALKNFKDFNDDRLLAEQAYLDERRKAGVTIDMTTQYNHNKWSKWAKELSIVLNQSDLNEPVGSFLPEEAVEIEAPKRRGRPPMNEASL